MAPRPPKPQNLFTPEEDALIIHLKATTTKTWKEIATHFPTRTKGSLQVRYCRKLLREQQRRQVASLTASSGEGSEAQAQSIIQPGESRSSPASVDASSQDEASTAGVEEPPGQALVGVRSSVEAVQVSTKIVPDIHTRSVRRATLRQRIQQPAMGGGKLSKNRSLKVRALARCRPEKSAPITKTWIEVPPLSSIEAARTGAPLVFTDPPATHIIEYNAKSGSHRIRHRKPHEIETEDDVLSSTEVHDEDEAQSRKTSPAASSSDEQARPRANSTPRRSVSPYEATHRLKIRKIRQPSPECTIEGTAAESPPSGRGRDVPEREGDDQRATGPLLQVIPASPSPESASCRQL